MDTTDSQDRAVTADVSAYKGEAQRLFEVEILGRWVNSHNVWRAAWAMDTILDYFTVCHVDGSMLGGVALQALNPTFLGNWWDDFGWIGIAALRAAEQNMAPLYRESFLKIAINAWAYMHGPGWSSETGSAVLPFQGAELPGWYEFAKGHEDNIGAANVWNKIGQTWPGASNEQIAKRKPRYSPGGAWNSPYTDESHASLKRSYDGSENYLNPVQNSVTNGLYAILTLRIHQASQNPNYQSVFDASGLDSATCLQAWKDQIAWIDHWILRTPAEESLLFDQGTGPLVRERVSTFAALSGVNYWDAAYRKNLVWAGDQGLFVGALREGACFFGPGLGPPVLGRYAAILEGTFNNAFANRRYGLDGIINGYFPLPWLDLAASDRYNAASPGGDNGDYQTGVGVYMRYLLQAYAAKPTIISDDRRKSILAMANQVIKPGFGTNAVPPGACDAFTAYSDGDLDQLTANVNRLSVLLLAISIASNA